jgi:oxygen-independent coproporphyrinogen-3 oxidase
VRDLRQTAVNRFSIGVQSFFEEDLRWMNRAHTAAEADGAVKRVQDAGFEQITLDLIYGYPLLSDEKWNLNLQKAIALDVPHFSAYSMTVEPQTALAAFIRKGKQQAMDDEQSARQLIRMMDVMPEAGYEQYEISNFARPGQYARHNSNYWQGIPYIGIGPSAHSYTGTQRQWNVANNLKYIASLQHGRIPFESETLTKTDMLNEYIMTSLRTSWGMDLQYLDQHFGSDYGQLVRDGLLTFIERGEVNIQGDVATLSTDGKLLADHIASVLFVSTD